MTLNNLGMMICTTPQAEDHAHCTSESSGMLIGVVQLGIWYVQGGWMVLSTQRRSQRGHHEDLQRGNPYGDLLRNGFCEKSVMLLQVSTNGM